MKTHAEKTQVNKNQSVASSGSGKRMEGEPTFQFADKRSETIAGIGLQEMANNSHFSENEAQLKAMAFSHTAKQKPIQKKESNTHTSILSSLQQRVGAVANNGFDSFVNKGGPVIQRASFFVGEERFKTEDFKDFSELEALAGELISSKNSVGIASLLDALQRDIAPTENKRTNWAKANGKNIQKLIDFISGGGKAVEEKQEVEKFLSVKIKVSQPGEENIVPGNFTSFEKGQKGDQGEIHFEKHGSEFEAKNKGEYIRMAKAFGESDSPDYIEAIVNNTFIRTDPKGMENRRVFIANGKTIRTFYVWNPDFSSDPFGYAIYYTITSNLGIPLKKLDPLIANQLAEYGVNLQSVENDYVLKSLNKWKNPEQISNETKLSVEEVKLIERWANSNGLLNYPINGEE